MNRISRAISWRTQRRRNDGPTMKCKMNRNFVSFSDDEDDDFGPGAYAVSGISRTPRQGVSSSQRPLSLQFDDDTVSSAVTFDLPPAPPRKQWCKGHWIIPMILVCGFTVTVAVLYATSGNHEDEGTSVPLEGISPCDAPVMSPNPFIQCECQGIITEVSDVVRDMYESLKTSVLKIHIDSDMEISSCRPVNKALLWTAVDIVNGSDNDSSGINRILNRFVLALTYASMGGETWKNKSGWLSFHLSECLWYGVGCAENGVSITSLTLPGNNVEGSLVSAMSLLPALQTLNLTDNSINGMIPEELWGMPTLEEVLLGGNKLVGTLPSRLSDHMPTLKRLSLFKNDIFGAMPELVGLTNLVELDLSETLINGDFPTEGLDTLDDLEILRLARVPGLTGTLPPSIGSLTGIKEIHLQETNISGEIPESIGNLVSLVYFRIEAFVLKGSIPTTVGYLTNLEYFQLSNSLTGTIPTTLGLMTSMTHLSLAHNSFVGSIPAEVANCTQLERILFNGNSNLGGTLPEGFDHLSKLLELDVSCTDIAGPFSDDLCHKPTLVFADAVQQAAFPECSCCEGPAAICELNALRT